MKTSDMRPPAHWQRIRTIDMHTGGEPLRVVTDGWPAMEGKSVLEIREFVRLHHDRWRKFLMWEPRGHSDMYGALITPSDVADFGVIFMHNEGYSTMCGHATIALGKLAVASGWIPAVKPLTKLTIEAPCGVLAVEVSVEADDNVSSVSFKNVPSYVVSRDNMIEIPEFGSGSYDLAYGGAYYACVVAQQFGLGLVPENVEKFKQLGKTLKKAIASQETIVHPTIPELSFLYGIIFTEKSDSPGVHSRNVCVFADGEVDRSPTGSGVSARLALLHASEEVRTGQWIEIESIIGSTFRCRVAATTKFGEKDAVIPEVTGTAYITGSHDFWCDPDDPFRGGFIL